MTDFHQTRMGKRFFGNHIPRIANALDRIAHTLEEGRDARDQDSKEKELRERKDGYAIGFYAIELVMKDYVQNHPAMIEIIRDIREIVHAEIGDDVSGFHPAAYEYLRQGRKKLLRLENRMRS